MVTLDDFEQILDMKAEIQVLTKRLQNCYKDDYVGDTAKDYSTGYERIIAIQGYAVVDFDKADKISEKIKDHKKNLEKKIFEAEQFILSVPDSRIRTLLTLRFLEGETWDNAAKKFYKKMTANTARMCIERYFENK